MASQSYGSAPSRNAASSPNIPSKISLPTPHASTVTADSSGNQGNGHTPGPAVKGFSGNGTLKAFVK